MIDDSKGREASVVPAFSFFRAAAGAGPAAQNAKSKTSAALYPGRYRRMIFAITFCEVPGD